MMSGRWTGSPEQRYAGSSRLGRNPGIRGLGSDQGAMRGEEIDRYE
jgi:hypothetical protein